MRQSREPEPPFLLDGHHVVRYGLIDTSRPPPPHFSVVAGGVPVDLDTVSRLVIAEDLVTGGFYLLHCNDDWATVAADGFADADSAQQDALQRYAGVALAWHRYRELTDRERREVETTREFLREIAADFPND
jgi:hypothetical protein